MCEGVKEEQRGEEVEGDSEETPLGRAAESTGEHHIRRPP